MTDDFRLFAIGPDERTVTLHPSDRARAEAIVAAFGGVLEMRYLNPRRLQMQWLDPQGQCVLVEGQHPAEMLGMIHAALQADSVTYLH